VEGKSGSATLTVTPAATTGLAQVSAGVDFSCGITTQGAVLCWGDNAFGTLGNGTTDNSAVAKAIAGGFTATSVSAGTGILGHACAVATTGAGYCWGSNLFGELGNGTSGGQSTTPVVVSGVAAFGAFGSGFGSTCAAGTDGTGYCWGGLSGGLGDGADTASGKTPVAILGGKVYKDVRAGYNFACGLTTDGRLFCWGLNNGGALGNGTQNGSPTPVQVAGHTFTAFDTGDGDVCGVATDGTFCWGINTAGEAGNGTTTIQTTPAAVAGGIAFTSVSVGSSHSCGLTAAGAAYCWGAGDVGQLGNNATLPSTTPVAVAGGHVFAAVSAGTRHTCGVTTTNEGWCWGAGTSGQLGNNGTQDSSIPVRVQLP
jgi:alpha-tubulin suppressor-like RCC1 family protein